MPSTMEVSFPGEEWAVALLLQAQAVPAGDSCGMQAQQGLPCAECQGGRQGGAALAREVPQALQAAIRK